MIHINKSGPKMYNFTLKLPRIPIMVTHDRPRTASLSVSPVHRHRIRTPAELVLREKKNKLDTTPLSDMAETLCRAGLRHHTQLPMLKQHRVSSVRMKRQPVYRDVHKRVSWIPKKHQPIFFTRARRSHP